MLPAHYLTGDTHTYPLVLLVDTGDALPAAHGVRLGYDGEDGCSDCGGPNVSFTLEVTESGGGNPAYEVPYCAACLVGGDYLGLIPTCYIEFVPYE
jgi:hypothetical protein